MAFTDLVGDLGISVGGFGSIGTFLLNFVIILVVICIGGFIAYTILSKRSFNLKIHKFENISGQTIPTEQDVAKEIVLPFTSTRAIYLKKHKIFLPRPSIQTAPKHYWYFIRPDGEWVNCKPQFNPETTDINFEFDHSDMRLANASLKKLVEKNYKKLNWLKEYAPYIGMAILILMLGITFFLIIGEAQKVTGGLSDAVDGIARSIELQNEILQSLDNIKNSGGSGLKDG